MSHHDHDHHDHANHDHAAEYAAAIAQFRQGKDEYFKTEESPIAEDERATFGGLHYFPPDYALRIEAKVERLPGGEHIQIATSDNMTRLYERYALLHFKIDGTAQKLTAYRTTDSPTADDGDAALLFVPFRDALSGTLTYGAGRYLDVEEEPTVGKVNTVAILDFNLAYNPYCAYNDNFSCPITPSENALPVAIRAGEQTYHQ